jgi:purine-binding chemotaxis protein CheW
MSSIPDLFTENDRDISSELEFQSLENPQGELHLRFYLASGDEFAFPAIGIAEVTQQSAEQITPIPNASPLLLGTINLRGKIVWVADLGQFLGDRGNLNTDRSEIPIIAIEDGEMVLGLAIERLGEMAWLDLEQLQTTHDLTDRIAPFIQGQWEIIKESTQFVRLLDQVAILRSARWAA